METRMDAREEALLTLMDIEKNGKKSHIAIRETLMRFQFAPKQDRAFYSRLCEGVLERKIYLDYILDHFSKKPMASCKPMIRNLLRMGSYQILFMDVRDAAACSEAVKLARKKHFSQLTGFVNGILRTIVRHKDRLPQPDRQENREEYLHVIYSMPKWIVTLLLEAYGPQETEKTLAFFLKPSPLTVRTNLSKISPDQLKEMLAAEGIGSEEGRIFPQALSLKGVNYLQGYQSFQEGYYTVQDESSMLPVMLADIHPGDTILDLCAAPGGKTLHAADRLGGKGLVSARDLSEAKTSYIYDNVERCGFDHVTIEAKDATVYDPAMENRADLVLADLPCSGLGVLGRKSDIRYRQSPDQLKDLVRLQREILAHAWRYLKPGGQLIYSTCTLNPGENEENVRWILDHTPLVPLSLEGRLPKAIAGKEGKERKGSGENYITLLPGSDHCDGFFAACFTRP